METLVLAGDGVLLRPLERRDCSGRESCRINESWHDDIVMAILAHEYRATSQNGG